MGLKMSGGEKLSARTASAVLAKGAKMIKGAGMTSAGRSD